jgi:PAS domain S-box-containing protein
MGRISHQLLKTVFPQPLLAIERHLLEHGFWEGELTHTTQQGKEVVINSRWTAKRDETGHIVAILEINQDITVQKQIEEEVQRLASFPLLNPNPVLEVDEDGHITYANPAARHAVEQLRLAEGAKAFVPPDLKEKFAAVRQGCPRQYTFDLSFKGKAYAVNLTFPHDLPAARLYALDITERQLSEEARRESEERYRSLVNLSPDSIMVHTKGKYIFVNPAGLELFGAARPEDLIGRRVLELVHPESQKNVRRRLKAGERLDIREVKILRLDGRPVEVEVAATPITYGGQPAVQVMLRDITERKAAEEALARSQAEFAAIFQSISDGIVFTDTQRRIAMVNPAAEDLFGYSPEEMQGRLTDFLYASQEDFKEQGRQRYHNQSEQSARVYEITYRRKDGSVFPAEARGGQVKNAQGQVLGFVSINRDVTECKQADEVLRESENRFRKVFENAAMGIAITDWEGGFQQCNPAYCIMLGYTEEELRRLTFPALIHPEDWDANVKEIHLLKAGKIPYFELENRYVHKDSRVVWVHKFVSVLPDITGKPAHLMALVTDITARKQAEETVRESEARFRSLFDSMTEGVALHQIIYDEPGTPVDYRILATNPAFTVHTGLAAEQIRGRLASEAYGAGEAPYLETYARVAHIGHPAVFETYFPPLGGSLLHRVRGHHRAQAGRGGPEGERGPLPGHRRAYPLWHLDGRS